MKVNIFTKKELEAAGWSKDQLAVEMGIQGVVPYDMNLPQGWLEEFAESSGLDYFLILFTTFWAYPDGSIFGMPLTGCLEVAIAIAKEHGVDYKQFSAEYLKSAGWSKERLAEEMGLNGFPYDLNLPRTWLNSFVEGSGLDHDTVQSTTFWAYPEGIKQGVPVSGCAEVTQALAASL